MKEGAFAIKTSGDAKNAWELFFSRFYSPEIPNEVMVKFDPNIKEFSPREDKDAKNQS